MPSFEYSGYGRADGKARRGVVEAADEKRAARALLDAGVLAGMLRPVSARGGFGAAARSAFYRELGALLGAGLPLDRALELMKDTPDKKLSAALVETLELVREGSALADAVARAAPDAADYERAAILSGERSASLPDMLPKLSELMDAGLEVRERLRGALAYPAFVAALGLTIGVVMLGFVAPWTMRSMSAAGMPLPRASLLIINGAKAGALCAALCALACAGAAALMRRRAPERLDRLLLCAPFMGQARKLAALRFAWILSVLADSGAPLVEALALAGAGAGRPWLRAHSAAQAERVRGGAPVSEAVGAIPVIGSELFEWVRAGEAGGCLARMLDAACGRLRRQWRSELERKLSLVEPALLLLVGLFVLLTALAMMLPVIGMAKAF